MRRLLCALAVLLGACHSDRDPVAVADALIQQGKTEKALGAVTRGLAHRPAGREYWQLCLRKARILKSLNRRPEALAWLSSLGDLGVSGPDLTIPLEGELGDIQGQLGHYREAEHAYAEAIRIGRATGQASRTASVELRRAFVLLKLQQPEAADACIDSVEKYARETGDHRFDAYISHHRGLLLLLTNHFEDAIEPLDRSRKEFIDRHNQTGAAAAMIGLAWCYFRLGQLDHARATYEAALQLASPEDRHLAVGHLGNMFFEQKAYREAEAQYQRAMTLAHGLDQDYYSQWLTNLATTLTEEGKWAEAEEKNREAMHIDAQIEGSSLGLHQAMLNSGRIAASRGDYAGALGILRPMTESPAADPTAAIGAYCEIAKVEERQGCPDKAKREFQAALALADRIGQGLREDGNKISYLAHLMTVQQEYVDFLMRHEETGAAFLAAEDSRARVLREKLNLPGDAARSHTLEEYRDAARRISAVFLAYWTAPQQSYLWVIRGDRVDPYTLPGEAEIQTMVERHQRLVENPRAQWSDPNADEALVRALLGPLGPLRPGARFVIAPSGPLFGLNFETLRVPGERPHFWIEDATIAVAPSLELLLRHRARSNSSGAALLVGDAIEWNPDFPALKKAGREISDIGRHFAAGKQRSLVGANANPEAFRQAHPEDFAYIHFAAHATANKNSPLDSAIVLSKLGGQGVLSVADIMATRMSDSLVSISACQSAGTSIYAGEGMVGLAWAFLRSGAWGVVAGLWNVSDYSSPQLMDAMYGGLAGRKPAMGAMEALRAAKLHVAAQAEYASPYYWGPFQLYLGALPGGAELSGQGGKRAGSLAARARRFVRQPLDQ